MPKYTLMMHLTVVTKPTVYHKQPNNQPLGCSSRIRTLYSASSLVSRENVSGPTSSGVAVSVSYERCYTNYMHNRCHIVIIVHNAN